MTDPASESQNAVMYPHIWWNRRTPIILPLDDPSRPIRTLMLINGPVNMSELVPWLMDHTDMWVVITRIEVLSVWNIAA